MYRFLPVLVLSLGLLAPTGCSTLHPSNSAASVTDSLRAANATLQARLRKTQDSLAFHRDLKSGQYYRDLRILKDQLNRLTYEVRTLRSGGKTVTLLPADSLFETGTATLTPAGTKRLRTVVTRLQKTYPARTIRVEGHTDSVPLGDELQKRFDSNWGLSCARATTVVRYLIAHSTLAPTQFAAVAYGATDPAASNDTATGRRRNRRVRIAVLPSPTGGYSRPFETSW